ncbi:MAG: hypothetical protein WCP07_02610 [bacterium]|jgi:membrane-bound serine protease (ClpP class)
MTGMIRAAFRSDGAPVKFLWQMLLHAGLAILLALCASIVAYAQGVVVAPAHPSSTGWLNSAAQIIVRPLPLFCLLAIGLLLVYWDLLTPTDWDLRGTLGVLFLITAFVAQVIIGEVGWVGIILLLAGLAGVLLEVHALPGRGLAIGGFALLFSGMLIALSSTHNAAFAALVTLFMTVVTGIAFLAYLPKSPAWQQERLRIQQQHAVLNPSVSDAPLLRPGQIGTTLIALRPTGTAEFMGIQAIVVSETGFLEPGATVRIERVEGDRIIVAAVTETVEASLELRG